MQMQWNANANVNSIQHKWNENFFTTATIDDEILGLVEEDKIGNKIEQSDEFKEGICTVVVQMGVALSLAAPAAPVLSSPISHVNVAHTHLTIRLQEAK